MLSRMEALQPRLLFVQPALVLVIRLFRCFSSRHFARNIHVDAAQRTCVGRPCAVHAVLLLLLLLLLLRNGGRRAK